MGVRSLSSYVNQHESTKQYRFSYLKNKVIAVDASVFMYHWMKMAKVCSIESRIQGKEEDLPEYHWEWHCIRCLDRLRKYKIKLIFLFDSGHPDEKQNTIDERKKKKQKAGELCDEWIQFMKDVKQKMDDIPYTQYSMKRKKRDVMDSIRHLIVSLDELSVKASGDHYQTLKKMIDWNGMKWMECPGEAEYIGVDMVTYGIVDYVMSNDSDCIACQCEKYITNFNWEKETFQWIDIEQLRNRMRLTKDEFRIACCCMGNDYIESVWEDGSYWGRVKSYISRKKLYNLSSLQIAYPDKKEEMEFCWKLYLRIEKMQKQEIENLICGSGRVSPRKIEQIRVSGVCV